MRPGAETRPTIREYLTVGEAAALLGVSASTLRNWDRLGKVAARRHPVNGYRLYMQKDLMRLLKRIEAPARSTRRGSSDAPVLRGRR